MRHPRDADAVTAALAPVRCALRAHRPDEARAAALAVAARDPGNAEAWYLAGRAAGQQGDFDAVIDLMGRADVLRPRDPFIRHALGMEAFRRGDVLGALPDLELAAATGAPVFRETLAVCLMRLGRGEEALPHFEAACAARPGDPLVWVNRAIALIECRRPAEAEADAARALALDPGDADAHVTLSTARLLLGRTDERTWRELDWVWRQAGTGGSPAPYAVPACPRWRGEALKGGVLWVRGRDGLGDQIFFSRFVPLAAERAGVPVVLSASRALHRLFAGLPGVAGQVDLFDRVEGAAAEIPLTALPQMFSGFPPPVLPGSPPPQTEGILRLGVVWRGKPEPRDRSVPVAALQRTLAGLPVVVSSFQVGPGREERPPDWADCGGEVADFADTARLLSQVDLAVSIDTSFAHLAASLGMPTWILLVRAADWRWLLEGPDCPWYPAARLFRQVRAGDWTVPLAELRIAVEGLLSRGNREP